MRTERLDETDGGGGLALTEGGGGDSGYYDVFAVGLVAKAVPDVEADFSFVAAVGLELGVEDAGLCGDLGDRAECCGLGDVDVRRDRSGQGQRRVVDDSVSHCYRA